VSDDVVIRARRDFEPDRDFLLTRAGGGGRPTPGSAGARPPPRPPPTPQPEEPLEEITVSAPRPDAAFVFPFLPLRDVRALRPVAKLVKASKLARFNLLGLLASLMGVAISSLAKLSDAKVRQLLAQLQSGRIDLLPLEIPPPLELEEVLVTAPRPPPVRVGAPQEVPFSQPWQPRFPGPEFFPPPVRLPVEVPDPTLQPVPIPVVAPVPLTIADPVARPGIGSPSPLALPVPLEIPLPLRDPKTRPRNPTSTPLQFRFPNPNLFRDPLRAPLTPFQQPLLSSPPTNASERCPPCTKRKKQKKKKTPRAICYRGTYRETSRSLSKRRKERIPCQPSKSKAP